MHMILLITTFIISLVSYLINCKLIVFFYYIIIFFVEIQIKLYLRSMDCRYIWCVSRVYANTIFKEQGTTL